MSGTAATQASHKSRTKTRDKWRQRAEGGRRRQKKKKIGQPFLKDAEMLGRKNDAYLIMLATLFAG